MFNIFLLNLKFGNLNVKNGRDDQFTVIFDYINSGLIPTLNHNSYLGHHESMMVVLFFNYSQYTGFYNQ